MDYCITIITKYMRGIVILCMQNLKAKVFV